MEMPPDFSGGISNVCSAVSYFSTLLGSIIGAGWLSFRVRDGSGRFPAAVAAVTLFNWAPCFWWWGVVSFGSWSWLRTTCGVTRFCSKGFVVTRLGVCKFSAG